MNKPLIIAHRGASGFAPENTLKAFDLALREGADGIELDVFLTKDKALVVFHDENLKRLTGYPLNIRKLALSVLKKISFVNGEKIPTLDEVFEEFGQKFSVINVEIKSTGFFSDGVEHYLISSIRQHHLTDRVLVSSFNPLHLLRIKKWAPDIQTGYLVSPVHFWSKRKFLIRKSHTLTLNLDHNWCTQKRLEMYKQFNKKIWVWTVNKESAMKKWIANGVDAIITNYPARLKAVRDG